MDNKSLYNSVCEEISKNLTKRYSTSFSGAIRLFPKDIRTPIYNIYGFVRLADEIVDTFDGFDKKLLLDNFIEEMNTSEALGISTNPILQSFLKTKKEYGIDSHCVEAFLDSMKMDLIENQVYDQQLYEKYIYGSAEVVGLMCLKVFLRGDQKEYDRLKFSAQNFGSALQKVNFLRDLQHDYKHLKRIYFPQLSFQNLNENKIKKRIIFEIEKNFEQAKKGIDQLPSDVKFAVELAYVYYLKLFNEIKKLDFNKLREKRVRIPNAIKVMLAMRVKLSKHINLFG